jgi:ZIP family zinc transporter
VSLLIFFIESNPVIQALLVSTFTWSVTELGADLVFLVRTVDKRTMDIMLGFSAGVTVTGSFCLLLVPAIEISTKVGMGSLAWVPAFASLIANLQMTIFSLKFHVHTCLPLLFNKEGCCRLHCRY